MENENKAIDLSAYFACVADSILKKWRIIVLVACFCAMSFDVVRSVMYHPVYGASVVCAVVDSDEKGLLTENAQKAKDSIQYLMNSHYMQEIVNRKLNQESFDGSIVTNMTADTNLSTIQVKASSQKNAYFELKQLIEEFQTVSNKFSFGFNLVTVEEITFANEALNSNSHIKNFLMGLAGGLAGCLLLIGVLSYLKDNVKTASEVNDKLDVRLFAKLPKDKKSYQGLLKKRALLVSNFKTSFGYVEAMNKLASKLETSALKHQYQTVLVTSALENEGKSSVVVNLAISLAKNKRRVLVIDADLRKPALNKIFDCTCEKSFSEVLDGKFSWQESVVSLEREHIDVIFSKKAENAHELLSSANLKTLWNEMKQHYDYILIDTAPSRYIADTAMMASSCDATLLVVKQNEASCKVINDTIYQLINASANVMGAVYNASVNEMFKPQSMYGYRYGYYRYHREGRSS